MLQNRARCSASTHLCGQPGTDNYYVVSTWELLMKSPHVRERVVGCVVATVLLSGSLLRAHMPAGSLVEQAGVKGGLIVHLGCGDGQLTAALRINDRYLVHGLDVDARQVRAAREHFRSLGLLGEVTASVFDGEHLPLVDNVVQLCIVDKRGDVPLSEVKRVLAPGGVVLVDGKPWEKAWPEEIDEWTHYLHGPDNNAVAHDKVVGPPRHMKWLAAPQWTRNHHKLNSISSAVTAAGRLFYIVDQSTAANMRVPGKWTIVARDAFSGVELWTKSLENWAWHDTRFRSGPPQVTRLLVASEDRVYAPLGLNMPISMLNAVTGETLKTFARTTGAEEIVLVDDLLLVLKGAPVAAHTRGHPRFAQRSTSPNQKSIVAVNTATGDTMWEWSDSEATPMPETLASDGRGVYIQIGEAVTRLDLESGREDWTYGERGAKKSLTGFGKYTLVVVDGVVLGKLAGQLVALSAEDGTKLWQCRAGGGFHSPLDVFVIDGLVWQGLHVSDSVSPPPVDDFDKGRDLHTGEIKTENSVMVDLQTAGHHHRCYREKATQRYILSGKRGIEMMDLGGDNHSRNNWVRGTCQYGILPANGLIYAPPHSCGCYMESKLRGFWALASKMPVVSSRARTLPAAKRLLKGPAFGEVDVAEPVPESDWPQYRHDPCRRGIAETTVPTSLTRNWTASFGGKLSQPVVANGTVLLACVDEGAVYALSENTGEVLWHYVTGGRVDSPPTVYQGTVLFGSADGHVYCLRLNDGELIWQCMAARADLRTVAFDQLESLWPVRGSVLVLNDIAYFAAGRSSWLDGGIILYGLDPATGEIIRQTDLRSTHPDIEDGKEQARPEQTKRLDQNMTDYKTFFAPDHSDAFSMAGGIVSDVLVSDGKNVFMHHATFSPELKMQKRMRRHLFSTSCLLDGTENHRSHWVLGTGDFSRVPVAYSWIVNAHGRRGGSKIAVPAGLMMVYNDHAVWGVRRNGINGSYTLFQRNNTPFSDDEESLPDFRNIPKEQVNAFNWTTKLAHRPRALLKSGGNLILGVMPMDIPKSAPHAAYEGEKGGAISVVSAEDGEPVAQYELNSPVVWDGMAAANEKLFLSTEDGAVECWAGR